METKKIKWFSNSFIFFIFIFLYFPIIVIVTYSFNKSKISTVWTGFTLDWFTKLFEDENILIAFKNSLEIALITTAISTCIGTLGALGLYRYKFKGKVMIDSLLYIPIVIPEIIMGIALLAYFSSLNMSLGILTIVLGHCTFCIPYVLIVVKSRLAGFDKSIEEAAMDLGANKAVVFKTVTLPLIYPGVVSGGMLAFALSLDDVIINFFVAGPESTTLPLKIFSMLKFGLTPEINALCTVMLTVTFFILIISQKIKAKSLKNQI